MPNVDTQKSNLSISKIFAVLANRSNNIELKSERNAEELNKLLNCYKRLKEVRVKRD